MSTQGLPPQGSPPPVPLRVRPTEEETAEKKGVGGTASPASLQGRGVTAQDASGTTGTAGKVHEEVKGKFGQAPATTSRVRAPAPPSTDGGPSLPSDSSSKASVSKTRPTPPPPLGKKPNTTDSASRPDERSLIQGEGLKAKADEKAGVIAKSVLPKAAAKREAPPSTAMRQAVSQFSTLDPKKQVEVFATLSPAQQKAITNEKVALLKNVVEEFHESEDKLNQEGLFRQESDVPVKAGEDLSKAEGKALAILYKKELRVLRDTGLPEGIITDDMMKIDLKTPEGRQQLANELNMPGNEQRKEIILGFLKLSGSITERSETNKMTASNIAIAVGPSLYRNEPDVMLAMARLEPESDFSNSILDNRGALIALLEPQSSPVQAGAPRDMPPRPARPDRPATPPTSASAPAPSVAAGTISRADFTTLSRDEKVGRFKDLSKEDQKTVFRNMNRGAPDLQRRIFSDMDTETRREFFNDLNVQIQGEFRAYL